MLLDGVTDITEVDARSHHFDTQVHAVIRDLDQALCLDRGLADEKHLAGVTMKPVLDDGDIYIQDVAVFQAFFAGYPVTDNVVDRGAD